MLSSCGLILRCSLCCPPGLSVRGRALLPPPPPPFHHVPWDYTENKTARRRGSKRNKLAVLWFLDLRIRRERATVLRSMRFCKLRKTTKPFSTSFSSQNAVSCLTMRTRALANRTNNKFLDTPAKQHLSL